MENTTTLHDDAGNIQNADHDDNGITHSLLLSKDFINVKLSSPNNHNYLNGNNDDKVNKEALEPMSSLQTQDSYNAFDKNNFQTDVSQALVDVREISGISDTNNLRKEQMNTKENKMNNNTIWDKRINNLFKVKAQFLRAKENSTHKIFTHNPDIEHSSKAHKYIDQKND